MTDQEAIEQFKERIAIEDYKQQIPKYYEAMELAVKSLEEIQKYRAIGTVEECREAVDKINYYQNLLGKKVWWIDGLGNRVESTINCFYIEQGIEGVRCELLNCTADAAEIGKSIHVIN